MRNFPTIALYCLDIMTKLLCNTVGEQGPKKQVLERIRFWKQRE